MNKAFVKEFDDTGRGNCPRCGSLGIAVQAETLAAQLKPEALAGLAESAFFCPFQRCDVAYFDAFERTVSVEQMKRPVWPKDPEAPLCGCFGLSRDDVEQDIRDGGAVRVRELLAKSKSPEANCLANSPTGQTCTSEVQRYFMRLRSASEAGHTAE